MNLKKSIEIICRSVCRSPIFWLFITLLPSLPALYGISHLGLNTDVVRLLPDSSPAAMWTGKLKNIVADGGFFTILIKSNDRQKLLEVVRETAAKAHQLEEVDTVNFTYPKEFIDKYRYLLIPVTNLEKILDYSLSLKAGLSPFTTDLLLDGSSESSSSVRDKKEIKRLFDQYSNLTLYHESDDGTVMGVFIRPKVDFTNIRNLHILMSKLEKISTDISANHGLWSGVGGSQINNLKEYDVILADLNRSGIITFIAVVLILILSFRSVVILPVLLYPLGVGLLWSFALVPPILGDLNIITSFLLIVLFGMGIDYSIHLLKRFQLELVSKDPEQALIETYCSTGRSVITSSLTTGSAFFVLAASDFRGFSEFGLIGGGTIFIILLAMLTVMPATMILGHRWGLVKSYQQTARGKKKVFSRFAVLIALFLPFCIVMAVTNLHFNYNFNTLKPQIAERKTFKKYNNEVYKTRYMSPGALYLAPDLDGLDQLLTVINNRMEQKGSLFQRATSLRDFAPEDRDGLERIDLVKAIQEQLSGSWIKKIEDPSIRLWAEDIRGWKIPEHSPQLGDIPKSLVNSLIVGENEKFYVAGIYPNVPRGNGNNAMTFTREMYDLKIPASIQGPVGEMPVFAEILWTVTGEGPWTLILSFGCVFLLIYTSFLSFKETLLITVPLISGLLLTMGMMAISDFKFNFFNVVIFPALIGMGVDSGIHYYRRWKELKMCTEDCQEELFMPLTICTVTTMMGYSGLVFATHPGLRSIGLLACLGLGCIWLASLVFFPAVLQFLGQKVLAGKK